MDVLLAMSEWLSEVMTYSFRENMLKKTQFNDFEIGSGK